MDLREIAGVTRTLCYAAVGIVTGDSLLHCVVERRNGLLLEITKREGGRVRKE